MANLRLQDGKLLMKGHAPTLDAANAVWSEIHAPLALPTAAAACDRHLYRILLPSSIPFGLSRAVLSPQCRRHRKPSKRSGKDCHFPKPQNIFSTSVEWFCREYRLSSVFN